MATPINQSSLENNGTTLDWAPYDRAAAIISFTLFALIVGLNAVVIYLLVLFRRKKKSRFFFFIFHLAAADILVGVVNVLGDGIQSTMGGDWYGGDILCRIWRFAKVVIIMASNNLLIGMSIDRFLAVKSPMFFVRNGNKLGRALVIGAWVLSVLVSVFFLPFSEGVNGDGNQLGYCDIKLPSNWWKPYLITVSMAQYLLPTAVITVCYVGISIVVWRKWKKGLQLSEINRDQSREKLRGDNNTNSGLLPKAKVKSIKLTLVICLAFLLCWTPYFVFQLLDVYGINTIERRLYMVVGMIYPLNSVSNPIIFILFNLKMIRTTSDTRNKYPTAYDGATQMSSV